MAEGEPLSETLRVGLLLETAQTQQRLAEEALEGLGAHVQMLDALVRTEVGRAAAESFAGLSAQVEQSAAALRRLRRATDVRLVAWSAAATVASAAIALAGVRALLPSTRQVAALRARRARFAADIRRLREYGGSVDLRRCGSRGRLCVRVYRDGPAYGPRGEFLLVKAP